MYSKGFERNRDIYHSLSHNMCLSSRVKIPSKQFCLYPYRPLQNYASLSTLALGGKKKIEGRLNYSTSTRLIQGFGLV